MRLDKSSDSSIKVGKHKHQPSQRERGKRGDKGELERKRKEGGRDEEKEGGEEGGKERRKGRWEGKMRGKG